MVRFDVENKVIQFLAYMDPFIHAVLTCVNPLLDCKKVVCIKIGRPP